MSKGTVVQPRAVPFESSTNGRKVSEYCVLKNDTGGAYGTGAS